MSVDIERRHSTVEEKDEEELAEFGYKQELKRDWGLMHNFGISFSIIVSVSSLSIESFWLIIVAVCYYWNYN
jgi:hypothetical protein